MVRTLQLLLDLYLYYHASTHTDVPQLVERGDATATYLDENGEFRKPEHINADVTWESSITS